MSDLINTNALRLKTIRNKNLSDFATQKELLWLAHNDDVTLGDAINYLSSQIIAGAYLKKVSYTIGAPGVTGVDYNFTSAANMTEQSIQLGAAAIIPASSPIASIVARCTTALVGGGSSSDVGKSSGSDEYLSTIDLSALNAINSAGPFPALIAASSVYFSAIPDANWSTLSAWVIEVDIFYYDTTI